LPIKTVPIKSLLMKRIVECLVFALGGTVFCNAQQIISTAGGEATGVGGTVSYTIGQVFYSTQTSTTGKVTQGVQQPYEILVVTGTDDANGISIEFMVYPNPATDYLKLKVGGYNLENLTFRLYDIQGSAIQKGEIVNQETIIETGGLPPAAYYLRVIDNQKEIKTFKIIKN